MMLAKWWCCFETRGREPVLTDQAPGQALHSDSVTQQYDTFHCLIFFLRGRSVVCAGSDVGSEIKHHR